MKSNQTSPVIAPVIGSTRIYSDFSTPNSIDKSNDETAYFHALGKDDRHDIIGRIYANNPVLAEGAIRRTTHLLSRYADLAEVWATDALRPTSPNAHYTRIN